MTAPLLIEIGVEEIPAFVSAGMADDLAARLCSLLDAQHVGINSHRQGVTPRRLLFYAPECPIRQADRTDTLWGPPERVAFKDGIPTAAAAGFAKKSGLAVDTFELADKGDGKGLYMKAARTVKGRPVIDIIAEVMPDILRKLPSPKSMRWQDGEDRMDVFIRPIRWIVARLGADVIPFSFAGVVSGKTSHGHRIHGCAGEIDVNHPFEWLEKQAVIADRDARRKHIDDALIKAASEAGVVRIEDQHLLDEVTDLTEWPHVVTGHYDEDFLRLPEEVSRIELKHHQRCFAARKPDGSASHVFFAVANLASKNTAAVAEGNERVVNARLADAMFYFERDPKESLALRVEKLSGVVFQDGLGTVRDQVRRMRGIMLAYADRLGVETQDAGRAVYLCKSDLTTGLVGEFPELQGYMGGVYARMDGEMDAVADAIRMHYMPVGAEDDLPDHPIARAIGIIERVDKLSSYFHLERVPTASADPFGLRRAAIGLILLLEDAQQTISMTLSQLLDISATQWHQQGVVIAPETLLAVKSFIHDRLSGMAEHFHVSRNALEAAQGASTEYTLHHQIKVARLLTDFAESESGQAVAAANKRVANILKKAGTMDAAVNPSLFVEDAEHSLFTALEKAKIDFPDAPDAQLDVLASLRQPVDDFFDDVMVMDKDEHLRCNRLALLAQLRRLFLNLADISCL